MPVMADWNFETPLRGSARSVSFVRLLLGGLVLMRWRSILTPALYFSNLRLGIFALIAYALALMMLSGFWGRLASFVSGFLILLTYHGHTFQIGKFFHSQLLASGSSGMPKHLDFLGVFCCLLSLCPCAEFFALDAFRRPPDTSDNLPLRGVQLIRIQVITVYFWTAIAKIIPEFLSGASLETNWAFAAQGSLKWEHDVAVMPFFAVASYLTIGIELSLAALLMFPRTRKVGAVVGLLFHLGTMVLLPVDIFAFSMIFVYILFLTPHDFDRISLKLLAGARPE